MKLPSVIPGRIHRRDFLRIGAGLSIATCIADWADADIIASGVTAAVNTTNGPIRGLVEEGVQTFRGVRYGAPPVGALRFMPPKKPEPWKSTVDCMRFGPASMQLSSGGSAVNFPGTVGAALGQLMESREDVVRQSEDCLFLNVWTPALGSAKQRPVMVWFHGGGFNYGSGSWTVYNGHNLAKNHDVIVVTVNHRLNAFGYLYLGEAGDSASGNVGMLDLVAVLEWVRDNISAFGGDPGNVTMFGQSGGGAKVSTLLAMPAAKGLVHRAIIESGPGLRGAVKETALANARAVMKNLGVLDVNSLKEVPAQKLLAAAAANENSGGTGGLRWGPVVDGVALPTHPFDPIAPVQSSGIPVMIGCTKDEQTLYNVGFPWWGKLTQAELVEKLRPQFKDKTDALISAFRKLRPNDSPSYLYTDIASTTFAFMGSITLAERKAAQNAAPVYMYIWEWGAPVDDGILRAPHTMELPFVFDNVDKGPILLGTAASTKALGKQASSVWTSFARTGTPAAAGIPKWPAYDAQTRATMMFDLKSRVENDPNAEIRKIMQG
jgi:para-nitrobenzyl esterase